jgi:hypothetical protein
MGLAIGSLTACDARTNAPTPPPPGPEPTISGTTTDLEELHAFAKLYGYVRFFHPSEASAAADWDFIAVDGARRVVQGSTRAELLANLQRVFEPLAPTLLVFPDDQPPPAAEPARDGPVIAWQHEGFGLGEPGSTYFSGRTGRGRRDSAEGLAWAPLMRDIPADQLRGKRVRLRGWARVDGDHPSERAQLWMRVDGPKGRQQFLENMPARPIVTTQWQEVTIESPPIEPDATNVALGGIAKGAGAVFFDDFTFEIADPGASTWTEFALDNGGFESGESGQLLAGWQFDSPSYTATAVPDAHGGSVALKIERQSGVTKRDLFAERPLVGETFERSLGAGLTCRVVLGLPADKEKTAKSTKPAALPDASDPAVRAAAVIVAWNVLRHFYPYHDVIGENWEDVLDLAITDVLDDRDPDDLLFTLRRLVHHLHDGHGRVGSPVSTRAFLRLRIARVEDTYVVLAAPKDYPVRRGDELVSIDDVAMDELFEQHASLVSGSPQWIEYFALAWGTVTEGREGTRARVEVRRTGGTHVFDIERTNDISNGFTPDEFERPYFTSLERGVLYVDLVRIPQDELKQRMPEIAKARAVIVDVRGYPTSEPIWLPHFLAEAERTKWMFVPHVIRPDYENVATFTQHGWDMDPAEPHVAGKVAFITGPGAISYAESLMGYVEGYQLGAIVGSATAGANGNINEFTTPGGFSIVFTGMKVTRMDGRQHHIVGVQPTHPVQRTLAGVRAGRDEELEAALALVRPQ